MKIDVKKPTYTQVPNAILDNMAEFTDAEFRLIMAICRQTFGWWVNGIQRESHKMSISFLMNATGMSNQGVINAYHRLSEKGVIFREADGDSFRYGLVVNDVDSQSTELIGVVNGVDRLLVNGVDTKKERDKETKKKQKAPKLTDDEFIQSLKQLYPWVDMDSEISRMKAWILAHPGRHLNRAFMSNWLGRSDKPIDFVATKPKRPKYLGRYDENNAPKRSDWPSSSDDDFAAIQRDYQAYLKRGEEL